MVSQPLKSDFLGLETLIMSKISQAYEFIFFNNLQNNSYQSNFNIIFSYFRKFQINELVTNNY